MAHLDEEDDGTRMKAWVQKTVCTGLDIDENIYNDWNEGGGAEDLMDFLSDAPCESCFVFILEGGEDDEDEDELAQMQDGNGLKPSTNDQRGPSLGRKAGDKFGLGHGGRGQRAIMEDEDGELTLRHDVLLPGVVPGTGLAGRRQVYLCKTINGPVTNCQDGAQIEFGVLTGDPLGDLSDILREVYIPLLDLAGSQGGSGLDDGPRSPSNRPERDETTRGGNRADWSDADGPDSPDLDRELESETKGSDNRTKSRNKAKQNRAVESLASSSLSRELRSNMQKFESQIEHALQQVHGDVHLYIPDIVITDLESVADDYETVSQLEEALDEWSKAVAQVVDQETRKTPQRAGPLAEIEFWQKRNAALSALYEQINIPTVQQMLKALELVEASMLPTFRFHFVELTKLYVEAKDNVKFLSTLERHFKAITTGTLSSILDTLPSMMNAIRMVWIISRHYNTDERMVPLMERIGGEIADKVATEISIRTILRRAPEAALKSISEAATVLESWYKTYMTVREKIEASGTDHRWEFDRKRLFEQTNYMAKICENLHEVAMVLDQFQKFLGPELKAVTGDSEGIDEVMRRVEALIDPLESVPFDIFDRRYKTSWDAVMSQFRVKVDEIEEMTKRFIDTSFQKLRSAEGAFDLLQNFQNIQSRESINRQMMQKFDDILLQYSKELERVRATFENNVSAPPVFKNFPPIAGAIAWAQHLYYRAKRPIMRFRKMESWFDGSQTWQNVMAEYISFAKVIKEFCKQKYGDWQEKAYTTSLLLQQSVLGPALVPIQDGENVEDYDSDSRISGMRLPDPPYYVNFSDELLRLIRETKYLDRMGYKVPEAALNVALQEEKYHGYVQSLQEMLGNYHAILHSLHPVERRLVASRLRELQAELRQGFDPCNWCSLHIPTLIERCTKAINEFQSVIGQIHKSSSMIEEVIESIESAALVDVHQFADRLGRSSAAKVVASSSAQAADGTMEISVLYETLEKSLQEKVASLVRKYQSIGPLLVKVEEIVASSNTGASPVLAEFYNFWEKRMYNAITKMVIRAIASFEVLLSLDRDSGVTAQAATEESNIGLGGSKNMRPPLCRVQATLNGSDVSVSPALTDIYKYVSRIVRSIVESSKSFHRWMRGTCKECEPVIISEDEDPIVFSFYQDVSKNPHVIKLMLELNHSFQRTFTTVRRYLDTWQRYDEVYGLWDAKRKDQLGRLRDKKPSSVFFDNRIAIYDKLSDTVRGQTSRKDIDFLRIDCYAVQAGLAARAQEWTIEYGMVLYEIAKGRLDALNEEITECRKVLDSDPQDLEELKHVLHVITSVNEKTMVKELEIADIMEGFRTLTKFNLVPDRLIVDTDEPALSAVPTSPKNPGNDVQTAKERIEEGENAFLTSRSLDEAWRQLVLDSKTKDLRMDTVKEEFRKVTQHSAEDFVTTVHNLKRTFEATGPGKKSSGDGELDEGVELVEHYVEKLGHMFREREQIVNAQKLFNLDITSYPELNQVKTELGKLQHIYSLYSELKQFEAEMSSMLWSELDVHALLKGAEALEKKLRKLPKELRAMPTYDAVEEAIVRFRDSIPLIQSLKNDAMKKRHWDKLSKVTGVVFEMDPKTFTLGALFEMKLARFEAEIAEIVNEGTQEAKIEKALKDIEEKWKETSFGVAKYKKNGVDKGFVLKSCDDIKLELEDNMLNLQTMGGSRFVVSFADVVRKWEKQLNHVLETIDVWFKVQSKWMYLESIFIGAEDIRMQLPEEAKKFDQVDKAWKGVMVSTSKNPNVVEACHAENRIETLRALSERLDLCQKSLSDYLDTKRNSFPRFFFISDDELLSVLGSSDPTSIQVHMLKLFDNTKYLQFGRGAKTVIGMGSSEDEEFSFATPAPVEGPVEQWMTTVETEMRKSLQKISKEGTFFYAKQDRVQWVDDNIGMTGLLGTQIWWTWEVEDVFHRVRDGNKHAMKQFADKLTSQLNDLVDKVRQQISSHMRKKVNSLLIIDVHARDIVDKFVRDSILDEREFAWESQLRFYWDQIKDDVVIRQCTGSFDYGYEFMGLNGRLVITPLTDRCYMTITQAHTFNLGTAPAGPAGTGKTETVKDLAKGMALPCFVINW